MNTPRCPGAVVFVAAVSSACTIVAAGEKPPSYDFQWARIGALNNPAYDDPSPFPGDADGRGSVSYRFRISKLEVTTGQWLEFANTFRPYFPNDGSFLRPIHWGGTPAIGPYFQLRDDIPNAAMVPVIGITWREAAMFCNWLHNDKATELWAIQDGAYDTSTFINGPFGSFLDQAAHHPAAKFWIPTWDEWIKSAHFDPNRYGPNKGGYWNYPNGTDAPLIPGVPGQGQTSAGLELPLGGHYFIPLGSYPDQLSPWGLLDVSGGAQEWTESVNVFGGMQLHRYIDGTNAGPTGLDWDGVSGYWASHPGFRGSYGLRVASLVPSVGSACVCGAFLGPLCRRRRLPCRGITQPHRLSSAS